MKKRTKGGKKQAMSDFTKKNSIIRKTPKTSAFNKGKASSNPYRPDPSGGKPGSQFRTRATINRLNMYRQKPDIKKMKARPTDPQAGRVNPDRKWFGNVRTAD
jgi:nuclear GTP-binding protein